MEVANTLAYSDTTIIIAIESLKYRPQVPVTLGKCPKGFKKAILTFWNIAGGATEKCNQILFTA